MSQTATLAPPRHGAATLLRIDRVRKAFGTLQAVDGLSLDIRAGEFFGLLGPNGAGKTTTLNMVLGQIVPDSGHIRISTADHGGDPTDPEVRQRLGVAPQALALYDELSAEENVRFFGALYGLHGVTLRERSAHVLERVGLTERRHSRAGTFSGGMKRRLNLAIALVHDPQVLLLDEPTVGVDPQSRNAIFELVTQLHREGRTIVYTTHYMEEAQRLCERVGIIDHGKLLALDTVAGLVSAHGGGSTIIIERAAGQERRASADPRNDLGPILKQADVLGVRIEQPSLESVFLNLTGRSLRD